MINAVIRFVQLVAAALLLLSFLAVQVMAALVVLFLVAFCGRGKR